jgi:hypothetical protein
MFDFDGAHDSGESRLLLDPTTGEPLEARDDHGGDR